MHAALKLLDKADSLGVADLTEETLSELKKLHPVGAEAHESVMMTGGDTILRPDHF